MSTKTKSSATAQSLSRPRPRISAPDPGFATVLVGEERKRFVVHESLLTHHSSFFRAALTGNFKEAENKTITLEEDESWIFEFFVHWLYYQHFPDRRKNDDPELVGRFYGGKYPRNLVVVKLYVFADKYGIRSLRRDAIDLLFNTTIIKNGLLPCCQTVTYAWKHLKGEDPLCRLLVDMFCSQDDDDYKQCEYYTSVPFLQAVWIRYIKAHHYGTGHNRLPLELCDYHEHDTEEEGKICKGNRKG